jgi:hypothetical protein
MWGSLLIPGGYDGAEHRSTSFRGHWILIGGDRVDRLDVRATLRTDDGVLEGGEQQFGHTEFFTQPLSETGDPNHAWPNAVECNISRVLNDD